MYVGAAVFDLNSGDYFDEIVLFNSHICVGGF